MNMKGAVYMFKLSRGNMVLGIICTMDLLSTLYLYLANRMVEANPVMAFLLSKGLFWFVIIKLLSYVPAVYVLEWYRRRDPKFAGLMTRAAIGGYLGIYVLGILTINS